MKRKVLIIDDEPGFTKIVKLILESRKKYVVRELNNPATALEVAREFLPDVILLDLIMPTLDGGDVRALISGDPALKHIPVLFVTASVNKREVDEHNGHIGDQFFVAKPVSADGLVRSIEEHIDL